MSWHTDTLKYISLDLKSLEANFKNTVCSEMYYFKKNYHVVFALCLFCRLNFQAYTTHHKLKVKWFSIYKCYLIYQMQIATGQDEFNA